MGVVNYRDRHAIALANHLQRHLHHASCVRAGIYGHSLLAGLPPID